MSKQGVRHFLTIDLEDWFHANLMDGHVDRSTAEARVETSMLRLLELLGEADARATIFVLGRVAERYPALVRKVAEQGHEIASHGYDHRLIYDQRPEEFRADVERSIECIGSAVGVRPVGYRAPSWSITRRSLWAIDILHDAGFIFDSSVFPFKTYLYGIPGAPRTPYRIKGPRGTLIEFPPSTVPLSGIHVPFSGGVYFRVLPYFIVRSFYRRFANEGFPALFYTHPWEFDDEAPRVRSLGIIESFIHYGNLTGMKAKVRRFMRDFHFCTIGDYLIRNPCRDDWPEVNREDFGLRS